MARMRIAWGSAVGWAAGLAACSVDLPAREQFAQQTGVWAGAVDAVLGDGFDAAEGAVADPGLTVRVEAGETAVVGDADAGDAADLAAAIEDVAVPGQDLADEIENADPDGALDDAESSDDVAVADAPKVDAPADAAPDGVPCVAKNEVCDGVDNDCDGKTDEDFAWEQKLPGGVGPMLAVNDTCGLGACAGGKVVCTLDKKQATCSSLVKKQPETCNDKDDNCDGVIDEGCNKDGDEYCDVALTVVGTPQVCPKGGGDCNDNSKPVFPDAPDLCNAIDDDCDGKTDEGFTYMHSGVPLAVGATCGLGECKNGTVICSNTTTATCNSLNKSSKETCNDKDDNCDGVTDEPFTYTENAKPVAIGAACGLGICAAGKVVCKDSASATCDSLTKIVTETCNAKDDNCDGVIDEGCGCPDGTESVDVSVAAGKKAVCSYLYPLWGYLPPSRPATDWTVSSDLATVTDTKTQFVWQRSPPTNGGPTSDGRYDWQGALKYCDDLVLAGADDWRLPTIVELLSIVDYGKSSPAAAASVFVVASGST
ncbi:MAG: DUF1566 domain-containing protein, partial [Myxococcales bacterium]|nr:DUF1566 domain-containing protein [Myxococcales bacterium]